MHDKYLLARSVCNAAAWDPAVVRRALNGDFVPEVDERLRYLRVEDSARQELLELALAFCTAVSEHELGAIRFVASRPSLVPQTDGAVWGIGQEWLELIRSARRRIVLVAPSIDAPAVRYMQDALSAAYSDNVSLIVLYGKLGNAERIRSAVSLIESSCPQSELLQWPSSEGFLHAKAICIDDKRIYIGSANLTEFGWERNVELGVTLSGVIAVPLISYCRGLVEIARSDAKSTLSRNLSQVTS